MTPIEQKTVQEPTSSTIKSNEPFTMIIPACCRLGLPSCKHVTDRHKKVKTNIGL
jgi:hypothetical protein